MHFPVAELIIGAIMLTSIVGLVAALRTPRLGRYQAVPVARSARHPSLRLLLVAVLLGASLLGLAGKQLMTILGQGTPRPARWADINHDRSVDVIDVQSVSAARGHKAGQPGWNPDLDLDGDGMIGDADIAIAAERWNNTPTLITRSSPATGEGGVAVTRETIINFSAPIDPATVSATTVTASFGRQSLNLRQHVSPDGKTLTLFPIGHLPSSARIRVTLDGNLLADARGDLIDADGDGLPGGKAIIDFDTLSLTAFPGTAVCGRVFATELGSSGGAAINVPLIGAVIAVEGAESTLRALSNSSGNFCLDPAPAGRFFVTIDGRQASNSVPLGAYYPFVGKAWESKPGQRTSIGDVFLPLIPTGTLQPVSSLNDTHIAFTPTVIAQHPELAGVSITVPADALYADSGARGGSVGIAPVPPDRLPGPLSPGLNFPVVITVQTDGASNFDRPVPACFPNLPDPKTGKQLRAGEKSALWSFDHDVGDFVIVGPMTVSADARLVCTDPGVGILEPGWHGTLPGIIALGGHIGNALNNFATGAQAIAEKAALRGIAGGFRGLPGDEKYASDFLNHYLDNETKGCEGNYNKEGCHIDYGSDSTVAQDIRNHPSFKQKQSLVENDLKARVAKAIADARRGNPPTRPKLDNYNTTTKGGMSFYDGTKIPTSQLSAGIGGVPEAKVDINNIIIKDDGSYTANVTYNIKDEYIFNKNDATLPEQGAKHLQSIGEVSPFENRISINNDVSSNISTPITPLLSRGVAIAADEDLQPLLGLDYGQTWTFSYNDLIGTIGPDNTIRVVNATTAAQGLHYFVIERWDTGDVVQRGITGSNGQAHDNLILAANTKYRERILQAETLSMANIVYITPDSGNRLQLPPFLLAASKTPDSDSDGLSDDAEFVIGTNPAKADTDGDGIKDGAEVQQGSDPLDGLPARTGIIGTADTPGTALDICASGDTVAVADGTAGLAVFNTFAGLRPILVAQVDTPGSAQAVACAGDTVVVADGAAGLALIDISDPPAARIVGQISLPGGAQAVAATADQAFVASGSDVVLVSLTSGVIIDQRTYAGGQVQDLALAEDSLYILTVAGSAPHTVHKVPLQNGLPLPSASLVVTGHPTFGRMHLAAGGGLIYVGAADDNTTNQVPGVEIIRDSGAALTLIGPSSPITAFDVAPTGSGLVVYTGADANLLSNPRVALLNMSDPTRTDRFLTSFDTPGAAMAVAINNGLAYVADGSAGLQVINYQSYDAKGVAPSITLGGLSASGIVEGALVRVTAQTSDDVQVRSVEFYVNDTLVGSDGSFPFEFRFRAPARGTQAGFTIRARAIDTGGNATLSNVLSAPLIADTQPPSVSILDPVNGETFSILSEGMLVNAAASDNVGVAVLVFKVDGVAVEAQRASFSAYLLPMPGPGTHSISAEATDTAGLSADSAQVTVNVIDLTLGGTISGSTPSADDIDSYTFEVQPGQIVYFDELNTVDCIPPLEWELVDTSGALIFSDGLGQSPCGVYDVGRYTLTRGGRYTLTIRSSGTAGGAYSFKLWPVPPDRQFALSIGDTVAANKPGAGAGSIETPGTRDIYTFNAAAGQIVYFDELNTVSCLSGIIWEVTDSKGTRIFSQNLGESSCGEIDAGRYTLSTGGIYTITVTGSHDAVGAYSFKLWAVPPDRQFALSIGDTVAQNIPAAGAGNIETPGTQDIYTFNATAGQIVYFDELSIVDCLAPFNWRVTDSTGVKIFEQKLGNSGCGETDAGAFTLSRGGTYTITVYGETDGAGTYSFKLTPQ